MKEVRGPSSTNRAQILEDEARVAEPRLFQSPSRSRWPQRPRWPAEGRMWMPRGQGTKRNGWRAGGGGRLICALQTPQRLVWQGTH